MSSEEKVVCPQCSGEMSTLVNRKTGEVVDVVFCEACGYVDLEKKKGGLMATAKTHPFLELLAAVDREKERILRERETAAKETS
jgi:Zn ribbon nucleic-acid-binding protein